ncbi:MAG: hypothetical protein ACLTZY_02615 [Alistipes indistinctus]
MARNRWIVLQIGLQVADERDALAEFNAVEGDQPLAEPERRRIGIAAAGGRADLLDGRHPDGQPVGVIGPVGQHHDLEILGRRLGNRAAHLVDLRAEGPELDRTETSGRKGGQVAVLQVEEQEPVVAVFEIDVVLVVDAAAVVVAVGTGRTRRPAEGAERNAESDLHGRLRFGQGRLIGGAATRRGASRKAGRGDQGGVSYDSVRFHEN